MPALIAVQLLKTLMSTDLQSDQHSQLVIPDDPSFVLRLIPFRFKAVLMALDAM